MTIFTLELKKIWNRRVLLLIAVLAVLTWFAFLQDVLESYKSLTTHGIYGSYQNEMFALFGDTLEPEELNDYDIRGKKALVTQKIDEIIAREPIFLDNDIHNFREYRTFMESINPNNLNEQDSAALDTMQKALEQYDENQSLDEWYASPLVKWDNLSALEETYLNYNTTLQNYVDTDNRPPVVQAANDLLHMGNNNLVRYDLCKTFSIYSAIVAVFSIIAVILLVTPLLTIDRVQKINHLQYSSAVGRKIFKIQWTAMLLSTLLLSLILIASSYAFFLSAGAKDYWTAHIMSFHFREMQLYNMTFGQYVLLLGVMNLLLNMGVASLIFALVRFSENIVTVLIKAVPFAAGISGLAVITINKAFSKDNLIFNTLFHGKLNMPEIILCILITLIGLIMTTMIILRERKVDLL